MSFSAYIKTFLIGISLIFITNLVCAQGTDSRNLISKQKQLFLNFAIEPLKSEITYSNTVFASDITSSNKLSINGLIEAGYYFTPFTAFTAGLGYSNLKKNYSLEEYATSFESIDSEDEVFEMRISGNNISENQVMHLIQLPFSLEGRFQLTEKFGLLVSGGVSLYLPLVSNYESSGTFTYSGYYSEYPVLLEDIPQYGFPKDLEMHYDGKLEIASILMGAHASAGLSLKLNTNLSVNLLLHYLQSVSEISGYKIPAEYYLTTQPGEIHSIMESSDQNGFNAYGIKFSLRYFLK